MIQKILKTKHWQLFLLFFGLPMLFQIILMGSVFAGLIKEGEPNMEVMFDYFKLIPLIMLFSIGTLFAWFWSIAVGLDKKIPEDLKLKVGRFKLFFAIPIICFVFISVFMATMMHGFLSTTAEPNLAIFGFIIPMHLFSMFCIFYCLFFVAKAIKTAELQKKVRFSDFAGEFFLAWFFMIGVWILKPRINILMKEE